MRDSIFLDTNIWVDYFEPGRKGHQIANELIEYCIENNILLLSSACSVNDLHYILQQDNKKTLRASGFESDKYFAVAQMAALECIDALTNITTVLASGHNEIRMACIMSKQHPDFEDNVLVATAMRGNSPLLVTEDKALKKHASITAMGASETLAYLKSMKAA